MSDDALLSEDDLPFAIPVVPGDQAREELKHRVYDRLVEQLDLAELRKLPEQNRRGELRLVVARFLAAQEPDLRPEVREPLIQSAVDLIVQAERLTGGVRRVTAITEVTGMEGDVIVSQDLFEFQQEGLDSRGRARGRFVATGVRPAFARRLEEAGLDVPPATFAQRTLMRA